MKHILTMGILALALMATTEQKASAWTKLNFGIGMNFNREAADNSVMKGLWRNGPHPFSQGYGHYGAPGYGVAPGGYGAPALPAPAPVPPQQDPSSTGNLVTPTPTPTPGPTGNLGSRTGRTQSASPISNAAYWSK